LNRTNSTLLSQLRRLCESRKTRRSARRSGFAAVCRMIGQTETLEQRQLLVTSPGLPTVIAAEWPLKVEWVQSPQDSARSFDITINRTGLVAGGQQMVVFESSIAPTIAAGGTEVYSVSQPLAAGTYSVSVVARGFDDSVSVASTSTFSYGQVAPQMLTVSGKPFSTIVENRPQAGRSVSLAWGILPGVQDYYLWIGKKTSGTFVQIASTTPRALKGGVYDVWLSPGEYQAKVRDLNNATLWSPIVDFEVIGTQSTIPSWTSTSQELAQGDALSWARVPLASKYQVELVGAATVITTVATPEYRGAFLQPGTYTARVRAADSDGRYWGWSPQVSFSVTSTTYKPQLTSNPSGVQVNGVTPVIWNGCGWQAAMRLG